MNRVPADDEAQRVLERRALANVAGLAQRLGYLDSDLALQRCAVDVWQSRGQEVRDEIRRTRPGMSARERGLLYEDRMRDLTIAKCGR